MPLDLFTTPPPVGGNAAATVVAQGQPPQALPPLQSQFTPKVYPPGTELVAVRTNINMGMKSYGTGLEVSVSCTSLHAAGDLEERTRLFNQDVAWSLWAIDQHSKTFTELLKKQGLPGWNTTAPSTGGGVPWP